ncbi:MAG: hypothetical protein KF789_03735 [Bdellovibrionaceae bacterium]|nr:hypothetical protein [Pseudobdellovibrionaceae bacterium]
MSENRNSFDWQQLMPVVLIAAAGLLLFFGLKGGGGSSKNTKNLVKDEKVQSNVNEHLRKTAEKIEMAKRQQAIRSWQLVNDYSRSVGEQAYVPPSEGANLQETDSAHEVAKDLGRSYDGSSAGSGNASDLIHQQMFEAQISQQADKAYKDAYASQFIENARRAGWDVKLDDNFKVISVKKIQRKPTNQFDLFK